MSSDHVRRFRELIAAYGAGDRHALRRHLAEDMVGYVTTADGGVDEVRGASAYVSRLPTGDEATFSVTVTQAVAVSPAEVLAMVEIQAERGGRTLHNHAGFLAHFGADDRIDALWMVDALPADSAEFWS